MGGRKEMEGAGELNLVNKEVGDQGEGGGGGGKGGGGNEGFIDRSKVRILLCDNDGKSSEEVLLLLLKCSYQVTSVRSARQVIDALNAEGPDFDIILAEVDLPMRKGMKMLKYITRDKELRRIPVIMMSAQDEVSIVVKCLRLGAADYLVKPLRTNELLNLWTHVWRRRRMLGLAEKNILICEFDLVVSDPSDANTNSTTLFSDDTDDKSWKSANPEIALFMHQEDETVVEAIYAASAAVEPLIAYAEDCGPDVPGISDRRTAFAGQFSVIPKKSELKIGESSAFFSYVKTAIVKNSPTAAPQAVRGSAGNWKTTNKDQTEHDQVACDTLIQENGDASEKSSLGEDFPSGSSLPDSLSMERSCTPSASTDYSQQRNFMDESSQMPVTVETCMDGSGLPPQSAFPFFMSGAVNPVMIPSSAQMYQNNIHDLQNHASSAMLPQYNHLPHCPSDVQRMTSFPYYPVGLCLPHGQVGSSQPWPFFGSNSSAAEKQTNNVDRREAALIKFRQKRKERCFDKKIRYINRKKLAERRPRVRGQFVRKANGVNVDLNGQPAYADDDEDEAEDDVDLAVSRDSFPEDAS